MNLQCSGRHNANVLVPEDRMLFWVAGTSVEENLERRSVRTGLAADV